MLDTMRKILLAGLGTLELTEEKLERALGTLIQRGDLTEREARALARQWKRRLATRRLELEREAREAARGALRGLNVASRKDLDALTRRVEALEGRVTKSRGLPRADLDPEC